MAGHGVGKDIDVWDGPGIQDRVADGEVAARVPIGADHPAARRDNGGENRDEYQISE